MKGIYAVQSYLGDPYMVTTIDGEAVIYRRLGNGYEFEVSGVKSASGPYILYVWSSNPREIVGIYAGIKGQEVLKDVLGYYSVKYQNLTNGIQVERED